MDNESKPRVQSPSPSINVTPLIDVLLVLLIIFMVISPRHEQKLPIVAPTPGGDPAAAETLMLTMSGEFRLELNRKPLTAEELRPVLVALMEQRTIEQRALFIKAPSLVPYDLVVSLIDCAKGAGVVTVGLIQGEV